MVALKACGHGAALSALIATFIGWLPPVAAFFTLVWTIMQIVISWPKFKQVIQQYFRR